MPLSRCTRSSAWIETLEARTLLAGFRAHTDLDGDVFAIRVIGAGDLTVAGSVTDVTGFLQSVNVTNTNSQSQLRVSLTNRAGDGRIDLANLIVDSPIGSILADVVDLRENGSLAIADVLKLSFGHIRQSPTAVDVGTMQLITGKRTATFGNVAGGGTINFLPRFRSVTFGDVEGMGLNFAGGADRVRSNANLRSMINSSAGLTEIDVVNALRASGIIIGDIKTIKAERIESDGGNFLNVDGSLGFVSSRTSFDGRLRANWFGTVKTDDYSGRIEYRGPDDRGFGVRSFTATGNWHAGRIAPASGGLDAAIDRVLALEWTGGMISGSGINTFRVTGDATNLDLNLSGQTGKPTLGAFTVGGRASGMLSIIGDTGPLRWGHSTSTDEFTIEDDNFREGRIGSIAITSKAQASSFNLSYGYLDSFSAAAGLDGADIELKGTSASVVNSFKVAGLIKDLDFDAPAAQGIRSFEAGGVDDSAIDLGFISAFTIKGSDRKFTDSDLDLRGQDASGFALRTARFGAGLENCNLRSMSMTGGGLGSLTSARYFNSDITAPTIGSILATGNPLESFAGMKVWAMSNPANGFSIGTIDIRGLAATSDIGAAGSIDKIRIACTHALNDTQEFRVSAGTTMTPTDMPANLSGFAPGARINRIEITKGFKLTSQEFTSALFMAPILAQIIINGLINYTGNNDGTGIFGFGAQDFGTVKFKDPQGGLITLFGVPLGINNPVPAEPLSNFRLVRFPPL
jgi:hypothetical protein